MPRSIRGIVVGVTALVAMLAMSANAFAVLVLRINESATTGSASGPILRLRSGVTSRCATSTVRATIANLNQVTLPLGGVAFNNCSLGTGTLAVTQLSAWTASISVLLNASNEATGVRTTFIVPSRGVQLTSGPCTFTLSGTRSTLNTLTPAVPLGQLATIGSLNFSDEEFGLSIDSVNNAIICGAAGVSVGSNNSNFIANYSLAPALTGTLVNLP